MQKIIWYLENYLHLIIKNILLMVPFYFVYTDVCCMLHLGTVILISVTLRTNYKNMIFNRVTRVLYQWIMPVWKDNGWTEWWRLSLCKCLSHKILWITIRSNIKTVIHLKKWRQNELRLEMHQRKQVKFDITWLYILNLEFKTLMKGYY